MIKARLVWLRDRIDGRSLRERLLLFGTLVALLFVMWSSNVMDPLLVEQERYVARAAETRQQTAEVEARIQALAQGSPRDPNADERQRIDALKGQLADFDRRLGESVAGLLAPAQMAVVLEDVLTRTAGLRLISAESLGTEPLLENGADGELHGVFRHGLKMVLEGDYLKALHYLRALQELSRDLYWEAVEIESIEYPRVRFAITVHTLSLEEGWIGV